MQSSMVSNRNISEAKRWDFEYFDPMYRETVDLLRASRWPVSHLNEIVSGLTDGQHGYLVHLPNGIPLLRTSNVFENEIRLDDVRYIAPEVHAEIKRSQLRPGDVLLTTIGSIGLAAVVDESLGEANINQNLVKMTPNPEINPWYLALFLNSRFGRIQTERTASKSVVPIVNYARLRESLVPVPPRSVQDRIAQVMQDAYAARQAKLAEADALLRTMDTWALDYLSVRHNGFLPPKSFKISSAVLGVRWDLNYHQPQNPVFGDQRHWCTLDKYAQVITVTTTPSRQPKESRYYVGIQSMANDPFSTTENAVDTPGEELAGIRKQFTGGDVLFARLGPTIINKKSAVVPPNIIEGYCSPEFLVLRPIEGVDSRFLLWLVKAGFLIEQALAKTRGATPSRARLYGEDLLSLFVPQSSQDQQHRIAQELEDRRINVANLVSEAETLITEAKARVERMILSEEHIP